MELYTLRLSLEEDKMLQLLDAWCLNLKHLPTRVGLRKKIQPRVAFKDHSKPKLQEKGKLITNPTRCFKCNDGWHIAINFPTKRTLVFIEDLNCLIEKSDDDCKEWIVDKDASSEDPYMASFEVLAK
ncbi:hypothetical protein M9H77_03408 [Catharanthus roseus]|uniref:Uncharacterized protein n=1 Tax=Catharanthus roseus TaxID=4058 RepID=A0ACC0CBC3_CATRO|nr:hypothetical protein M9H77_03408 [Catharanthus roseus]